MHICKKIVKKIAIFKIMGQYAAPVGHRSNVFNVV